MTIISALMVWYIFGVFAAVAAGYSWFLLAVFLAGIVQFGISSWLFLIFPKTGRKFSIIKALIMCIWPIEIILFYHHDGFLTIYFLGQQPTE